MIVALFENNLYRFLQRCASSSNFLSDLQKMSDDFYKSSFFLQYQMLLYSMYC